MKTSDDLNILCEAKHGRYLYNRHDTIVGKCLEYYGEFAEGEIELFQQFVKPGDIVIEAGANIGTHTIPLARMVGNSGEVHSFEAQRILFQTLCANLALNSITNVYAHNKAVGAENGSIAVPDIPYQASTNMGAYSLKDERYKRKELVELIALDNLLPDRRVAFIMADIERMELELLKGAQKIITTHQPIIYLENDPKFPESEEVNDLLKLWNYRIYRHVVHNHNPDNYNKKVEPILSTAAYNILAVPAHRTLSSTESMQEL